MKDITLHKRTIFDTPFITPFIRMLCRFFLWVSGWEKEGGMPKNCQRCVIIAAPHSSNWDFPITLALFFLFRLKKVYWTGKESLFSFPFKTTMGWLGGIPIDRKLSNNYVEQLVELLRTNEEMMIVIQPEGTRKKVKEWKSGFYNVAREAGVPIVLGFLDYAKKTGGVLGTFTPSGKKEDTIIEIHKIKKRYKGIVGKNHD